MKKHLNFKLFIALSLVFVIFLFAACEQEPEKYHINFDYDAYNAAKGKWESLNCTNYTYTYSVFADYGPGPDVKVTVENGISSYVILADETDESGSEDISLGNDEYFTVESLFKVIQESYEGALEEAANPPEGLVSENIDVSYDEETGIPTKIELYGSWTVSMDGDWWNINIKDIEVKQ